MKGNYRITHNKDHKPEKRNTVKMKVRGYTIILKPEGRSLEDIPAKR